MGLFSNGDNMGDAKARQTEADKGTAQRRGRNTVTVAEVQCRSTRRTGRPIFGAKPRRSS